jgi:isocitrate/isopropylmalate dehydrogenase
MMLRHLGEHEPGDRLEGAVAAVLAAGDHVTADLRTAVDDRPPATTIEVADAVIERL